MITSKSKPEQNLMMKKIMRFCQEAQNAYNKVYKANDD